MRHNHALLDAQQVAVRWGSKAAVGMWLHHVFCSAQPLAHFANVMPVDSTVLTVGFCGG